MDLTVTVGEIDGFSTGLWADFGGGGTGGVLTTGGLLCGPIFWPRWGRTQLVDY